MNLSTMRKTCFWMTAVMAVGMGIGLGACGSGGQKTDATGLAPGAPSWVSTGRAPTYPASHYLVGVGLSEPALMPDEALERAKASALAEIAHQIETRVVSEIRSQSRDVSRDDHHTQRIVTETDTILQSRQVVGGLAELEKYFDRSSGTGAVLAVVSRARLADRFLGDATRAQKEALAHLAEWEQGGATGDPATGLKLLVQARHALSSALAEAVRARAVGLADETPARVKALKLDELWNRVARNFDQMAGAIRVEVASGNAQRVGLSGNAPAPVTVKFVTTAGRPVAGFPVIVYCMRDAEKVVLHRDTTDREGTITFSLKGLRVTGVASNTAEVALDFAAVAEHVTLPPPSARITYTLPTRASTRVAVVIQESIDRAPHEPSRVAAMLREHLAGLGFQVVSPTLPAPAATLVRETTEALIHTFQPACDYLIAGVVETGLSSETGGLVFYKCQAEVRALELASGGIVSVVVPREETKAGGRKGQKAQVAEDSLDRAAAVLAKTLGQKFAARFTAGGGWQE